MIAVIETTTKYYRQGDGMDWKYEKARCAYGVLDGQKYPGETSLDAIDLEIIAETPACRLNKEAAEYKKESNRE